MSDYTSFFNKKFYDESVIIDGYRDKDANYIKVNDNSIAFDSYCYHVYGGKWYSDGVHIFKHKQKNICESRTTKDYDLFDNIEFGNPNNRSLHCYYGKYIKISDYKKICKTYTKLIINDLLFEVSKADIYVDKSEIRKRVDKIIDRDE